MTYVIAGVGEAYDTDRDIPWTSSIVTGLFGLSAAQLQPNGSGGSDVGYRTREGIERFMLTDINNPASSAVAQSGVPVMFDVIQSARAQSNSTWGAEFGVGRFNHVPGGCNVLYMDGHVEFVRYRTWPASEGVATGAAYGGGWDGASPW